MTTTAACSTPNPVHFLCLWCYRTLPVHRHANPPRIHPEFVGGVWPCECGVRYWRSVFWRYTWREWIDALNRRTTIIGPDGTTVGPD